MLKPITISIGIAAATALAQPTLAANLPGSQTASISQPANNLISQVVVSFPSAKIKVGSTTVILGKSEGDRHKEERYERRYRRTSNWEYYRNRSSDRDDYYSDRQDRDDDRH
jgi:hypothetical protein